MKDEIYIKGNEIDKKSHEANVLNSSVKIIIDLYNFGSGFFIKFNKNNGKTFYCLMTNQHVITPEIIEEKEKIQVFYENEKKNLIIELEQEDRFIKYYKDSLKIDATVIQILDKDNIEDNYFLTPNYDYENGYQQFKGKTMSVAQYPLGEELSMSTGIITHNNNIVFSHTASTLEGSSGGPIVLEGSDKVLGIHFGGSESKQENYGYFIGPVIDDIKKFKRNGFGKEFYKNGDIKYIGYFINDQYDDDRGIFFYEEGYKDDIYYYEKGDFFNGKFKEGKKIEGKIYDKNYNIKFEGLFQNDIPIIDSSDSNSNDSNRNNHHNDDNDNDNDNENYKDEDSKDNNYDENDSNRYEQDYIDDFGERYNDEGNIDNRENKENNNINSMANINNNSNNNNSVQIQSHNDQKKGNIINAVKKFVYKGIDPIKNLIPFPIKCRACKHKIQSHKMIGDAIWTCSECRNNRICYVE